MTLQSALSGLFLLQDCSGASEKVLKLFHRGCKFTTCRPQVKICADAHLDLSHCKGTKTALVGTRNPPLFLVVQMQLKHAYSCRWCLKELMKSISISLSRATALVPQVTLVSPQLVSAAPRSPSGVENPEYKHNSLNKTY